MYPPNCKPLSQIFKQKLLVETTFRMISGLAEFMRKLPHAVRHKKFKLKLKYHGK